MNFLLNIFDHPANERLFLLLPIGYKTDKVDVPDSSRKVLVEVPVYNE